MNIMLLKGKMAERGVNNRGLAAMLRKSENTTSQKMTGKSKWTLEDVLLVCDGLSLCMEDRCNIFLK